MKPLFSTQYVALSLSAGIGLGSILIGATPSEAQVTINVTGGNVSGDYFLDDIQNPTGTLITPFGVYTGPFAAGQNSTLAFAFLGTTIFRSLGNNDFTGDAYVNGTLTPFAGKLDLTVDSTWSDPFSNVSKNITGGTITMNTPTSLTGFSFEAPVTPPTPPVTPPTPPVTPPAPPVTPPAPPVTPPTPPVTPPAPPVTPPAPPVTPPTTSVTPPTTSVTPPTPPVTPPTPTFSTVDIPELTATTFTIAEPLTEPGGAGQTALRYQWQQPQQLRPNGVHTRIIPTWTPGLYQ